MGFPSHRLRRLRRTAGLRRMRRETRLSRDNLVQPFFVTFGSGVRQPIPSMPGQMQLSVDTLVQDCHAVVQAGVPAVIVFGIPEHKDEMGSHAYSMDAPVQQAVKALKREFGSDLVVITDVCMCEYTSHGHCGALTPDGEVDNDKTLELLARVAVSQCEAGADMVAPSDMMDGRVGYIRKALDEAGFSRVPIMSYAAKYASCFYGPFRDAAESAPQFGDRTGYQMDPPNVREALLEMELDLEEGADILMVKPAMPYLDVVRLARDAFDVPIAAYQVSGEYAMIKGAAERGWVNGERAMLESLMGIRRAGADIIITYFALEAAKLL